MNLELKEVATDSVHAVGEAASALAGEVHNMMPGGKTSRWRMSKPMMIMVMIAAAASGGFLWWKQRQSNHDGDDHASGHDHHDHSRHSDSSLDRDSSAHNDSTSPEAQGRHLRSA